MTGGPCVGYSYTTTHILLRRTNKWDELSSSRISCWKARARTCRVYEGALCGRTRDYRASPFLPSLTRALARCGKDDERLKYLNVTHARRFPRTNVVLNSDTVPIRIVLMYTHTHDINTVTRWRRVRRTSNYLHSNETPKLGGWAFVGPGWWCIGLYCTRRIIVIWIRQWTRKLRLK